MIEDVIVTEPWATMDADKRSYIGLEIAEDAIVGLKRLAGGGVGEWCEAVVRAFKRGRCHFHVVKGLVENELSSKEFVKVIEMRGCLPLCDV